MPDWKVSPLLDAMELGERFFVRDGVECYHIRHPESGMTFVLKHVSVPKKQEQIQALLLSGACADVDEAEAYYGREADALVEEAERSKKLLDCPYILPFLGAQKEPKQEEVGFDVFAVMQSRLPLHEVLQKGTITHLQGINLGIDLCAALEALREAGSVHANIKPENIFLSENGRFQLGDFGLISTQDSQYAVLPEQYKGAYTAPELFDAVNGFGTTVDIYALGMVLYRIYNGNHAPFEDENNGPEQAEALRRKGDELPAPIYADYELAKIILTACARDPEDRYQTPVQLRQALEQYMQRNAVNDQPIVPPLIADPEPLPPETAEEEPEQPEQPAEPQPEPQPEPPQEQPDTDETTEIYKTLRPVTGSKTGEFVAQEKERLRRRAADRTHRSHVRKRTGWILFSILMVLFVVAIALYEFTPVSRGLYHYFVTVESLETSDITAESITLHMHANMDESKFTATCQDAYGNSFQSGFTEGTAVFTGLNPGTQYSLQVELEGLHRLSGVTSCVAATMPETEILTFSAAAGSQEGSALLTLVVRDESAEPETWTVLYGAEDGQTQTWSFSGHSTQIDGLTVGSAYTFTLQGSETLYLTGETSVSFTPEPGILADTLQLAEVEKNAATVRWHCGENLPEEWILSCTDPAETPLPITAQEPEQTDDGWLCTARIENFVPGTGYLVKVGAAGLFQGLSLEIPDTLIYVDSFTAELSENGILLNWKANRNPEAGWLITGSFGEGEDMQLAETATGGSLLLASAIPDVTYSFVLRPADGSRIEGVTAAEIKTNEAERFERLGVKGKGTTIGMYDTPDKEDWTFWELGDGTVKLTPESRITVVITAGGWPEKSDETLEILWVVRNEDRSVRDLRRAELAWNEMWNQNRWMADMPYVPEEEGSYTLTVYAGGLRLGTIGFTVTIPEPEPEETGDNG